LSSELTGVIPKAPDGSPASAEARSTVPPAALPRAAGRKLDRSIVEGPIAQAVWKLAWPTVLQNVIGGLQGIIDHAMVGHYVGFTGNAAIGVSWQIFLVVIVFISSLFTGMGVLVARFAGANEHDKVNRTVYQAFLTALVLALAVMAPLGYVLSPALLELVHATPAVRNLIREGKTHQIYSAMQAGGKYGMQTMDQALANHVKAGSISLATAVERCANVDDLKRLSGLAV
jgi:hypothetical protein